MRSAIKSKWTVPIAIVILFAVLIFMVNSIQSRFIYSDRMVQLTTYYSQLESIISTRFTRYYKLLRSWSYHLEHEKSSGIEDFNSYISTEKRIWDVEQIYLFDEEGNYLDTEGNIGSIDENKDFINRLKTVGDKQVSHIIGTNGKRLDLFVLSVKPGKYEGVTYRAIGMGLDSYQMKSRLSVKRRDMAGSLNYLVDKNGNLIITSVKQSQEIENIVDYISENGEVLYDPIGKGFRAEIESRLTGAIVMELDEIAYYITFMPCGIDDSMLVCLTPANAVDKNISQVKMINNILLIVAFAIVLIVIMVIVRYLSVQEMLVVANSANETKTRFLANMSHDFRTPMNALAGYLTLMKENADDPDKVREYGEKAEYAHRNMLNMINCVLDLSKMEEGGDEVRYERFYLSDVLNRVGQEMGALADNKRLKLTIDRGKVKEDIFVGDDLKLEIILKNIIQNAVTYTENDGIINVDITPENEEDTERLMLRFEIKDNGIGMGSEFLEHIFEPFKREQRKNASKEQGTGLGLTVTKKMVESLGGTINVESKINEGSIFTVRLAFDIAPKTELDEIREIEEVLENGNMQDDSGDENTFEGMRFLAAEDNELNAEILTEILKMQGAALVDVAEDGEKAVEAFKEKGEGYYDMVLMDIQMPNMDGYQASMTIRAMKDEGRKDAGKIPIIAMSANAFKDDIEKTSESGMDAHIPKPIDLKLFENTVKALKVRGHESL
ncbi:MULTISPECIES: hybrid sensor histidine kinase/response regulator [unclassified Butyrivibrio]|uniref:hybrid sensor histidine kinase/response regulator n=1 Tax=unclassified Butyrivibrio TaxID=2639466 RepID=UPI00040E95EA|nr:MULTISPECIES: ATP-binding protein [unclassified Butyrivibrio]SEM46212.1 His Kinase A (phospho-acceptor) domain-containing protein [Butyrivibrio sp. ob235]